MSTPLDMDRIAKDLGAERRGNMNATGGYFGAVQLAADFASIVRTPNVCGGSARLIRTRIPIWLLQQMRVLGFTDAKILECYPTLTAGDLAQAWDYAAANKAEIDKEIEENERY